MAKSTGSKGNPASTRMSNAHRKAHRASMWEKQRKRKEELKKAEEGRHRANVETHKEGGMTPWEKAKEERRKRRLIGSHRS